jgi:hypothetical protein
MGSCPGGTITGIASAAAERDLYKEHTHLHGLLPVPFLQVVVGRIDAHSELANAVYQHWRPNGGSVESGHTHEVIEFGFHWRHRWGAVMIMGW